MFEMKEAIVPIRQAKAAQHSGGAVLMILLMCVQRRCRPQRECEMWADSTWRKPLKRNMVTGLSKPLFLNVFS